MGRKRRHHFVPKFYLAGFTDSGSANGTLYVLDTQLSKRWPKSAEDSAHKRDFYTVSIADGDPLIVEDFLAKLEGKWAPILKSVIADNQLPVGEKLETLMQFVGYMAVRVPGIRTEISDFVAEVRRKENFAQDWLIKNGHEVDAQTTRDEAIDQTWLVQQMIEQANRLWPVLAQRHWCLWKTGDESQHLICSDHPVVPSWVAPMAATPPGFGIPNTVISIPLCKSMAMVSMLERDIGDRIIGGHEVAALNSTTAMFARQLYSPVLDFMWLKSDATIGNSEDLMNTFK